MEKTASVLFLLGGGLELSNPALVLAGVALPQVAFPEHYHRYARQVDRFLPTIGRLSSP